MTAHLRRLGPAELDRLLGARHVTVPTARPDRIGMVHLGVGAFHRAHQAVYTEDAMASRDEWRWGICGVTQRSSAVVEQMRPQAGLYSVLFRGVDSIDARVVGSVLEVLSGPAENAAVRARIADPAVRVVTLTVTEKGYRLAADGGLDVRDDDVAADLAGGQPRTAVGRLVRGLQDRWQGDGGPLNAVSCDNLVANGRTLRRLVLDFCGALEGGAGEPLGAWIESNVAFPCTVVDRIVPATTEQDQADAARLLGVHDSGLVVAEPFSQWVIEDSFVAARPAWESAGAVIAADVGPYEAAKLRMLNATHSLLAYAGALAGYDTIAQAVADDALAAAAERLMTEDAVPTLARTAHLDLASYGRSVLQRFANPALRHRTTQVAMDGSQKLPVRLLPTIRERLRHGAEPRWAALAVAAWMVYVEQGRDVRGRALPLHDPLADRLRHAASDGPPTGLVRRMLRLTEIFEPELSSSPVLADLLEDHVPRLRALVTGTTKPSVLISG